MSDSPLAEQLRRIVTALDAGTPDGIPLALTGELPGGTGFLVTIRPDGTADLKTRFLHLGTWGSWSKAFPLVVA